MGKKTAFLAFSTELCRNFIGGMRGALPVTFEEGTHSSWLYDLLSRRAARLTLARKIAAIALKIWKKGEAFDADEKRTWRVEIPFAKTCAGRIKVHSFTVSR
jgi:hypothetical protein